MKWPFVTRRTYEVEVARREAWESAHNGLLEYVQNCSVALDKNSKVIEENQKQNQINGASIEDGNKAVAGLVGILAQIKSIIAPGQRMITLSVEELATLVHPPASQTTTPTPAKPKGKGKEKKVEATPAQREAVKSLADPVTDDDHDEFEAGEADLSELDVKTLSPFFGS